MGKLVGIIGAGEVGSNLTKALNKENYEITVVDINPHKIRKITGS